jgi:hypothetical protein
MGKQLTNQKKQLTNQKMCDKMKANRIAGLVVLKGWCGREKNKRKEGEKHAC